MWCHIIQRISESSQERKLTVIAQQQGEHYLCRVTTSYYAQCSTYTTTRNRHKSLALRSAKISRARLLTPVIPEVRVLGWKVTINLRSGYVKKQENKTHFADEGAKAELGDKPLYLFVPRDPRL